MTSINSKDLGSLSKQYAARDLPAHQKLKYRDVGQAAPDELKKDRKDLKKDLETREKLTSAGGSTSKEANKRLSITDKEPGEVKKKKIEPAVPINLDADEVLPDDDSDDEGHKAKGRKHRNDESDDEENEPRDNEESDEDEDENDDDDDDDDDDDTEALMAELNRIKQERAAEAARQEAERKAREEKIRVENILKGNPLLSSVDPKSSSSSIDFKVKRNWDDDVVFKNCAKLDDSKPKEFINDTLRSDFHKKFMDRYIK